MPSELNYTPPTAILRSIAQILALDMLADIPFYPGDACQCSNDENVRRSPIYAYRNAVEITNLSKHHKVASLVWDWVLSRPELMGTRYDEYAALSVASARYADSSTLEAYRPTPATCSRAVLGGPKG